MPDNQPVDVASGTAAPMPTVAEDWPAQAADTIVRVVGQVRDKTTGPVQKVARGVVFGLLAGFLGIVCLVLVAITLVRIFDSYIVGEGNTWLTYLLAAVCFIVPGLLLWSKGRQPVQHRRRESPGPVSG